MIEFVQFFLTEAFDWQTFHWYHAVHNQTFIPLSFWIFITFYEALFISLMKYVVEQDISPTVKTIVPTKQK